MDTLTDIEQAAAIIQGELVEPIPVVLPPPPPPEDPHAKDLNDDIEYARERIKDVIDDGRSALNGIMELAAASEEPRAYEVLAELMTSVIQANKELINIHEVRKKALKADKEAKHVDGPSNQPISIDKAVFVGRASDILRELHAVKVQTAAALKAAKSNSDCGPTS
jgi:hypothetical protein